MFEKILRVLRSLPATLIGGAGLIAAFVLARLGIACPVDPAWAAVVICGIPLAHLAVWRLVNARGILKISSPLLITTACVAAILIGDVFAAGEVVFIMAIGEFLEDLTTARAQKGLRRLIELAPAQARRLVDGREDVVEAEALCVGDTVRVLPGERIPADGVIVRGETAVDQSVMTGESLPADKTVGDGVFCGTVNGFGAVDVRVTRQSEDTALAQLIRTVRAAEEKKAPMARIADRAAAWLVPAALLIALVTGLVTQDVVRAVTVLVVFCPCALVLATPTAIMAAVGQATRHGVIIKSGEALERCGRIDTVAFDKTGTLTFGRPAVTDAVPLDAAWDADALCAVTAAAEAGSEHPLGRAVVHHAQACGLNVAAATDFCATAGRGMAATVDGRRVVCGSAAYLAALGVDTAAAQATADSLLADGKALIFTAVDGTLVGLLALADTVRPEAAEAVRRLHACGVHTVLLTGDNAAAAQHVARQVGITEVHADLLPDGKVAAIEALHAAGRTVACVGDGVNDAPALKTAAVGISQGDIGSDIAVEAADVVLVSDDLSRLPYLKRLATATVHTVVGGIALSMLINVVAVVLSVLGVLGPTAGALVHNAGSCLVVLIAALLYERKL